MLKETENFDYDEEAICLFGMSRRVLILAGHIQDEEAIENLTFLNDEIRKALGVIAMCSEALPEDEEFFRIEYSECLANIQEQLEELEEQGVNLQLN